MVICLIISTKQNDLHYYKRDSGKRCQAVGGLSTEHKL